MFFMLDHKEPTVKAACTFAKDLGPKLNPAEPLPHARPPFASSHDFLPRAILNLFDAQFHEAVVSYALEPCVISSRTSGNRQPLPTSRHNQ